MAGLTCSIVIFSGALGTVLFGIAAEKTGRMVEITKICCFGSIICLLVLSYLLLMPDVMGYIIAASVLLGVFTLGVFPLALELTVEATYPADQVIIQSVPYQIGSSLRFKDKNTHIILENPSNFCKTYFTMAL